MTNNSNHMLSRGLRGLPADSIASSSISSSALKEYVKNASNELNEIWKTSPRWKYTTRVYSASDVISLRSSSAALSYQIDKSSSKNYIAPNCSYSHGSSTKLYNLLRSLHDHGGYSRKYFCDKRFFIQ